MPENQDINRLPDGTFAPGCSGNPGGRPPGSVGLKRLVQEALQQPPDPDLVPLVPAGAQTWAEGLIHAILTDAVRGDRDARRLIFEYCEGRPTQALEVSKPMVPILGPDEATDAVLAALNLAGIVPIIDDLQ